MKKIIDSPKAIRIGEIRIIKDLISAYYKFRDDLLVITTETSGVNGSFEFDDLTVSEVSEVLEYLDIYFQLREH